MPEDLHASELRYRSLFESAKDGILILDAETGKIVDVNPFLIDLLGYTKQNFIEKSIWEIGAFQDVYESKEKFWELLKKKYVRRDDLSLLTSTGKSIQVEFVSNIYQVEFVNNEYIKNLRKVIQCNIRDISERKLLENELINAKEKAEESGTRMLNIINNIVDISKIETGLMELDMKETNVNEQIEYVCTFFKPETDAKRIKLSFKNPLA